MYRGTNLWEGVRATVNANCQRAYKEHKHVLKIYFDEVGGYGDVEGTRMNPPKVMDDEAWIDMTGLLFLNEGYRNGVEKGKECRTKPPHISARGSRSYTDRHCKEVIKFICII